MIQRMRFAFVLATLLAFSACAATATQIIESDQWIDPATNTTTYAIYVDGKDTFHMIVDKSGNGSDYKIKMQVRPGNDPLGWSPPIDVTPSIDGRRGGFTDCSVTSPGFANATFECSGDILRRDPVYIPDPYDTVNMGNLSNVLYSWRLVLDVTPDPASKAVSISSKTTTTLRTSYLPYNADFNFCQLLGKQFRNITLHPGGLGNTGDIKSPVAGTIDGESFSFAFGAGVPNQTTPFGGADTFSLLADETKLEDARTPVAFIPKVQLSGALNGLNASLDWFHFRLLEDVANSDPTGDVANLDFRFTTIDGQLPEKDLSVDYTMTFTANTQEAPETEAQYCARFEQIRDADCPFDRCMEKSGVCVELLTLCQQNLKETSECEERLGCMVNASGCFENPSAFASTDVQCARKYLETNMCTDIPELRCGLSGDLCIPITIAPTDVCAAAAAENRTCPAKQGCYLYRNNSCNFRQETMDAYTSCVTTSDCPTVPDCENSGGKCSYNAESSADQVCRWNWAFSGQCPPSIRCQMNDAEGYCFYNSSVVPPGSNPTCTDIFGANHTCLASDGCVMIASQCVKGVMPTTLCGQIYANSSECPSRLGCHFNMEATSCIVDTGVLNNQVMCARYYAQSSHCPGEHGCGLIAGENCEYVLRPMSEVCQEELNTNQTCPEEIGCQTVSNGSCVYTGIHRGQAKCNSLYNNGQGGCPADQKCKLVDGQCTYHAMDTPQQRCSSLFTINQTCAKEFYCELQSKLDQLGNTQLDCIYNFTEAAAGPEPDDCTEIYVATQDCPLDKECGFVKDICVYVPTPEVPTTLCGSRMHHDRICPRSLACVLSVSGECTVNETEVTPQVACARSLASSGTCASALGCSLVANTTCEFTYVSPQERCAKASLDACMSISGCVINGTVQCAYDVATSLENEKCERLFEQTHVCSATSGCLKTPDNKCSFNRILTPDEQCVASHAINNTCDRESSCWTFKNGSCHYFGGPRCEGEYFTMGLCSAADSCEMYQGNCVAHSDVPLPTELCARKMYVDKICPSELGCVFDNSGECTFDADLFTKDVLCSRNYAVVGKCNTTGCGMVDSEHCVDTEVSPEEACGQLHTADGTCAEWIGCVYNQDHMCLYSSAKMRQEEQCLDDKKTTGFCLEARGCVMRDNHCLTAQTPLEKCRAMHNRNGTCSPTHGACDLLPNGTCIYDEFSNKMLPDTAAVFAQLLIRGSNVIFNQILKNKREQFMEAFRLDLRKALGVRYVEVIDVEIPGIYIKYTLEVPTPDDVEAMLRDVENLRMRDPAVWMTNVYTLYGNEATLDQKYEQGYTIRVVESFSSETDRPIGIDFVDKPVKVTKKPLSSAVIVAIVVIVILVVAVVAAGGVILLRKEKESRSKKYAQMDVEADDGREFEGAAVRDADDVDVELKPQRAQPQRGYPPSAAAAAGGLRPGYPQAAGGLAPPAGQREGAASPGSTGPASPASPNNKVDDGEIRLDLDLDDEI